MSGTIKSAAPAAPGVKTRADLYAHALAIETEAAERYAMLADQMEEHHNAELAGLFRKLSGIEAKHAKEIEDRAADLDLPALDPWEYSWTGPDSPEALDVHEAHYLMTPHQALRLALKAEERAFAFFEGLAKTLDDPDLRPIIEEFAEEERDHVRLVKELLERYPPPAEGWDEDMDPPVTQE